MNDHIRWLSEELERWERDRLITGDQAALIRERYSQPAKGKAWGTIVFSGFGAVVIGLGVVLLLAYNWSEIPRLVKMAIIFSAMLGSHGVGYWLRAKEGWTRDLGEAMSLLGSLLFGAGIWLVAQAYHIEEHFPNGFLLWGLGALALAWAMDSIPQGILAAVTLSIWGGAELFGFDSPNAWALGLVVVAVGGLAWRKKSPILSAVVLGFSYFLLLANSGYWNGSAGVFSSALSLSVLLCAADAFCGDAGDGAIRKVVRFFGLSGFLVCGYILSFHDAARALLVWGSRHPFGSTAFLGYGWLLFALALGVWIWRWVRQLRGIAPAVTVERWLCPIALVYCQGLVITGYYDDPWFVAIVFNLVLLGFACSWMFRGCRDGRLGPTVLGSLLLAAVVFARYFDLFPSLAMRGAVFLAFGAVLFAEGFFYRKLRRGGREERGQS